MYENDDYLFLVTLLYMCKNFFINMNIIVHRRERIPMSISLDSVATMTFFYTKCLGIVEQLYIS